MSDSQSIQVKREGYAWSGETSGHRFAVFDRKQVEAVIGPLDQHHAHNVALMLTDWTEFYRGPGRAFGDPPRARIYRHAVLVTQRTGLDI